MGKDAASARVPRFEEALRRRRTNVGNDLPGEGPRTADPGLREREGEILGRVRSGEPEAFEYFVKTYQRKVFRLVYTLVRNAAEADALTQDVFVKAWRAVPDFKGEAAFETWLNRIAVNAVRDAARRRKPVVSFSELADAEGVDAELPRALEPTDGTSPERDALSRQIRRRIGEALEALSPRQRSIFVMKHYEERSIAEIGAATGLDDGTVKSHLFRAARKLRQKLEDLR
jgi:RNA polymerase sigma-70 factor (ECF subfamily)